jgi:pyruvate dehydrogenase E2 component (dihydrolipoamide acetyltransferase)
VTIAIRESVGPRVWASPLARRTAREAGLDLTGLPGSGPRGRIVDKDVRSVLARRGTIVSMSPTPLREAPSTAPPREASGANIRETYATSPHEVIAVDGMRRAIARRMSLSKQTVPHFYVSVDCRLDALVDMRTYINAGAPVGAGGVPEYRLTINDFLVKAMALALQRVPDANVVWAEEAVLRFDRSDVGVAIAVPGGLYTPVVRRAETLSLAAISAQVRAFAGRARERKLTTEDMSGGVTTLSNLGMHGVREFQAIINPPQSSILAIGSGEERIIARDGSPNVARMMTLTLSADHRAIDGAVAAELLAVFRHLVENPMTLAV